MRIRFLGTGTSTGVPEIGCECKVCKSTDKRDKRLRASVKIQVDGKNILIDCGPDFREQMLGIGFAPITGLLLTHEHYDHVGGIDDLRPFCRFGDIPIYAHKHVADTMRQRIPYCFSDHKYPGAPNIVLNEITTEEFEVEGINIIPVRLMHYKLPILGFRIGNFAYLTDLKTIPDEEYEKLHNLDVLVMNALRIEEHLTHQNLNQALAQVERIKPRKAYFTHMSHQIGLHSEIGNLLPENVYFAYDGLEIEI